MFAEALARELAADGVSVWVLCPGPTRLEIWSAGAKPALPVNTEDAGLLTIEEGFGIYNALLADRSLTIPDVQVGFEPLRAYPNGVSSESLWVLNVVRRSATVLKHRCSAADYAQDATTHATIRLNLHQARYRRDLTSPWVHPVGSLPAILDRLLNNLEGIKLSQHRAERILVGMGS